jgi:hypothetical protein
MSANDIAYQRRQWMIKAPLGVSLIGLGVSLVGEAAMVKYSGGATLDWILYGTVALVVLNAGLCILVDAGKHRAHYERLRDDEH